MRLEPPSDFGAMGLANGGELLIEATYRRFIDDERERERESGGGSTRKGKGITDVRTAAEASTKAGIKASLTARAMAMTKAASMRAQSVRAASVRQLNRFKRSSKNPASSSSSSSYLGDAAEISKLEKSIQSMVIQSERQANAEGSEYVNVLDQWDPYGPLGEGGAGVEDTLEEVMAELQEQLERDERIKEKREDRWIARSDRPWFQFVALLLGVVIALLLLIGVIGYDILSLVIDTKT